MSKEWEKAQELELGYWIKGFDTSRTQPNVTSEHSRLIWERQGVAPGDWAGKAILDVGCGPTARLACFFEVADVDGLDPLLADYRRIEGVDLWGYRNLMPIKAEGKHRGIVEWYDVVACMNVLDHCESPSFVVNNMLAYCKPGGIGFLSTDCHPVHDAMHPHSFQAGHVNEMILDAGWAITKHDQGRSYPVIVGGQVTHWLDGWTEASTAHHWWLRKPKTKEPYDG